MSRKYEQLKIPAIAPITPGVAPEQKTRVGGLSSGWLEQYCVIRCKREYWYWRYCWWEGSIRIKHKHVPSHKVKAIAYMIQRRSPIEDILKLLKCCP